MWVADMDFRVAPCILEALQERVNHGIFGYTEIPSRWAKAYQNWWSKRHDFRIEEHWLVFCTGIVPALSSLVRKLTTPNESVLVQSPVYNCFFSSIKNNGTRVLCNELVYKNGEYEIDWADFEKKLSDPQTTLFILCNPHNPIGKIWKKTELARMGELCAKHGVTVISDEIHCDLTEPNLSYTPFASASEICENIGISCISPTKAFNIAGLNTAAVFAKNKFLRHKAYRAFNTDEIAEPNAFAVTATIAAYEKGSEWLDELRVYLSENKKIVRDNSVQAGLTADWTRATFIVRVSHLQKLKDFAYTERVPIKEALDVALERFLQDQHNLLSHDKERHGGEILRIDGEKTYTVKEVAERQGFMVK